MTSHSARQVAIDELSRVDYFLDQLARAVERGEVPLESYDVLAPRYLAQRERLLATITGRAAPAARETSATVGQPAAGLGAPAVARAEASAGLPTQTVQPRPRRERTPVHWTTVLLFLGAFLVIVASGIFAAAMWDVTGPAFKLAFLGALTVGFYVAGYFARVKYQLRAGGTALTVVASAMLLFDCWIVIDGYNLTGPYPWAIAMLVCSAVYWLSEVILGERFYGVVGAAAQIAWWWLLGAGLGVEAPVRIAGIAVVAAVWQLAADRVEPESAAATLAEVLGWAAPVVGTVSVAAILGNLVAIDYPDTAAILSAGVVAASCAFIAWRSKRIPGKARSVAAAIAQIPFLLSLVSSSDIVQWWMVGALAAAVAVYAGVSLLGGGTPFAILALVAEFSVVGLAGELFPSVSEAVATAVYAGLAVSWIAAARITEESSGGALTERFPGTAAFSRCAWIGGVSLLGIASVMALAELDAVPMGSADIVGADVALSAAILAAWAAGSLIRRRPILAVGASLWSYVALATLVAWTMPGADVGWHYLLLVALGGVWLALRGSMSRFYDVDVEVFGWLTRAVMLLLLLAGLVSGAVAHDGIGTWPSAALALAGAALFLGDALLNSEFACAAIAGVFGVVSAALAGGAVALARSASFTDVASMGVRPWGYEGMAGAAGALACCAIALALKPRFRSQAVAFALAAAVTGSLASEAALGDAWYGAIALALVACAWTAAAFVTEWYWLAGIGGALAIGSVACVLSALEASAWMTVAVFVVLACAFNALSAVPACGPRGRLRAVGWSLAIAGMAALAVLATVASWARVDDPDSLLAQLVWLDIGWHGVAVVLAFLGGIAVVQSRTWRIEPALYVGCGVGVLAAMCEYHALHLVTAELYSTTLSIYVVGMGYLYARQDPARRVPMATDILGTVILLWTPVVASLTTPAGPDLFYHTAWAIGLSLVAITAGITLRVRAYLYGGAVAIALVALWRTATYLARFWWVVLGVIGIAMLVIALTWERQRMLLSDTQRRLRDGFEKWR